MRFEFDKEKSLGVKRKHGVSLKEAQEIFDQAYIYYHLVTSWKATKEEEQSYVENV